MFFSFLIISIIIIKCGQRIPSPLLRMRMKTFGKGSGNGTSTGSRTLRWQLYLVSAIYIVDNSYRYIASWLRCGSWPTSRQGNWKYLQRNGNMSLISLLEPIESRFEWNKVQLWFKHNWFLSVYSSAVYVILIFLGKRWMRDKPAYSLRRPLTMWNSGLAAFSVMGLLKVAPPLIRNVRENGFMVSVCRDCEFSNPSTALWGTLFFLSKQVEFGDTFFVVLRKTPLNFIHWYHHITVLVYASYGIVHISAVANWFAAANFLVHSVMYTYYALKASGLRIPTSVSQIITTLQLVQFVLGLTVLVAACIHRSNGGMCDATDGLLAIGLTVYSSYVVLFLNFFYQRYIK